MSNIVNPNSPLVKCVDCGKVYFRGVRAPVQCEAGSPFVPVEAMTQDDIDALLEAERERVIRAFGLPIVISDGVREKLRGAK